VLVEIGRLALVAVAIVGSTGCDVFSQSGRESSRPDSAVATEPGCPITIPSGDRAPDEGSWPVNHRSGRLWGWVPGQALVLPSDPDGSFSVKFGWWRGVSGELHIDGRRLDGSAAPARAHIPSGYGDLGFQSSAIVFPTPGCWEITGRVGGERLTFIVEIADAYPR
jgi:hypothetical protein